MIRNSLARALAMGLLAASPLLATVASAPAHATTFADLSVEQMTDASTWIVRGEVIETWAEADAYDRVWSRARVRVTTSYKGANTPAEIVVDQLGGTVGNLSLDVPGRAWFSAGEDVLLFLNQHESGRVGVVQKFLGKYNIRRTPGSDDLYVRTWSQRERAAIPYDGRFLPHPPTEAMLSLNDLLARVQDRVAKGWDGAPIPGLTDAQLRDINLPEKRIPR